MRLKAGIVKSCKFDPAAESERFFPSQSLYNPETAGDGTSVKEIPLTTLRVFSILVQSCSLDLFYDLKSNQVLPSVCSVRIHDGRDDFSVSKPAQRGLISTCRSS